MFTVDAATGNTAVAGTLGVTGTTTFGNIELHAYTSSLGANPYTIPSGVTVVELATDGVVTSPIAVTLPAGTNGQLLYIHVSDPDGTTGGVVIPANATWTLVYSGGAWRHAN